MNEANALAWLRYSSAMSSRKKLVSSNYSLDLQNVLHFFRGLVENQKMCIILKCDFKSEDT